MGKHYLLTSESVTEGHPDKLCDRISDAVLDAYLEQDQQSRVACETAATTGVIAVMGEITSTAVVDLQRIVRNAVRETGYVGERFGFDAGSCAVLTTLDKQSEDIDAGVSRSLEEKRGTGHDDSCCRTDEVPVYEKVGAGDQGMMFGFACDETPTLMPAPIYYAHMLCRRLSTVRKDRSLAYLGPDGKSMVTFSYIQGKPAGIRTIVVSTQHDPDITQEVIRKDLVEHVIRPVIPSVYMHNTEILINPTGRFVKGGPCADTGLTGRKIIVDTYGGAGRHGGGAFSGKDPTKVDRTGAYAARYVAKNIIAARIAKRCEVQVAYAIGMARPVSVQVETFGTGMHPDEEIAKMVAQLFDLRPAYIIEHFQLRRPIYQALSAYGHFGRDDLDLPWEKTDMTDAIRDYFAHKQ